MNPLKLAVLSISIGVFPLLIALLASLIARACGCTLNEADPHACMLLGKDVGGLLYSMFVFGWFGMLTVPAGAIGLLASAVWAVLK